MQTSPQILSSAQRRTSSYLSYVPLPVAFIEVTPGMPSRDCRGFGICKIDVLSEICFKTKLQRQQPVFNKALATLHSLNPETMLLKVRKSSLDKFTSEKHFERELFELVEPLDLILSEFIYAEQTTRKVKLLSGKYPIYQDRECYVITMSVWVKEGA